MDDKRRNPIDFGSWGQRSRSTLPPCEGMPRFALSSVIMICECARSCKFYPKLRLASGFTLKKVQAVIGKRFLPMGHFQLFFNDFENFNGPFLIILQRLWWAVFQVNWTMAHGPLPSQSLYKNGNSARVEDVQPHNVTSGRPCYSGSDNFSSGISGKLPKIATSNAIFSRMADRIAANFCMKI